MTQHPQTSRRWDLIRVALARRFFFACLLQAVVIGTIAGLLGAVFGKQDSSPRLRLPPAFIFSTVFLLIGSGALVKAHRYVRQERQDKFRRWLLTALVFAVLFVAVQAFGLWSIDKGDHSTEAAQLGAHGFAIGITALHAMHFIVAQSVLLWVTLSAFANRYDHEYYWGVTVASWFWHALGIVWLAILLVFTMAWIS